MTIPVAAFARSVQAASETRHGFQALQTVEAGSLKMEAWVRRVGPRAVDVEYREFVSPWSELEETLSGQVEFIGSELSGLRLHSDEAFTWIFDASTQTVIKKPGRQLYEPLPGVSVLAEVSFLDSLARDFLLRDLGEQDRDPGRIRRIALKPKHSVRTHLLSVVTFPIRRATVGIDAETHFPTTISFLPSAGSLAAQILGPESEVRISYRDVQFPDDAAPPPPYEPPAGTRVFEESSASLEEAPGIAPFSLPLEPLADHGFDLSRASVTMTLEAGNDRGFAIVQIPSTEITADGSRAFHLAVTVGNYISRNMARRRADFSTYGRSSETDEGSVRLLNRADLWQERLPGIDIQYAPVEAFFEIEGVFWFLNATGRDLDQIDAIANDLQRAAHNVG